MRARAARTLALPDLRARCSLALGLPAFARLRLAARRPALRAGLLAAALCALAASACGARSERGAAELPTAVIHVGNHRLGVEIAATPASRGRGLMFRTELPEDRGMLFVFPEEKVLEFWMRNTEIPLSIAFADSSGRIVRIADMEPRSEAVVSSSAPARYALEVNRGWFAEHGVRSGDTLSRLPSPNVE